MKPEQLFLALATLAMSGFTAILLLAGGWPLALLTGILATAFVWRLVDDMDKDRG